MVNVCGTYWCNKQLQQYKLVYWLTVFHHSAYDLSRRQDPEKREGDGSSEALPLLREAVPGTEPRQSREVSAHLPQRDATQDRVRDAQEPRRPVAAMTEDTAVMCDCGRC